MRMLSDSLVGVDEGSSPAMASPPPLSEPASAMWAWTASQAAAQAQMTPDGRISTSTTRGFVDVAHTVLLLAALLCTLVGVFSLQSLLRCALHYCGHRRSSALARAGLKMSAIRRMPVSVYQAEAPGALAGAECAICLGEFEDGEAVRLLPRCRHGFHVHCIDTWLSAHSSCPICRDSLLHEETVDVS